MPSPLVNTTIQACVMAAVSNLTAQFITAYRTQSNYSINWTPVVQFVIFTALNTPPNFLWQSLLESTFPSHTVVPSTPTATNNEKPHDKAQPTPEPKLSISNTLIKFSLDQSLGAAVNTVLFCLAIAGFKGATFQQAIGSAREEFWPLMSAGWTLWPLVSAINYTLVRTVEGRSLVGGLAGMGWGVYLSLVTN